MGLDLEAIAAVDQQGYTLLRPELAATLPYSAIFTESHDSDVIKQHGQQTLAYCRGVQAMAALLHCEPTLEAVTAQRSALGWEDLVARCLTAARLEALVLDDSFLPHATLPLPWHRTYVPSHRLLQLESLAETLLPQVTQFDIFLEWFRSELDPPPDKVVAFKSAVAYRGGLDIAPVPYDQAALSFEEAHRAIAADVEAGRPVETIRDAVRLDKPLAQFLLLHALEIAAKYRLPVQFHAGLGDATLDLRLANPLHLRAVVETPLYRQIPIVLLNTAYPYLREAAYLAAAYPQVYIDYGRIAMLQSTAGGERSLEVLLELIPTSKLLYGSGAQFLPDAFYLAAATTRRVLARVLETAVAAGDLPPQAAEDAAIAVLRGNAQRIYSLSIA